MNHAAFAAIVRDDVVLLVRSRTTPEYVNHWSLPGGLVEPGESLQAAAKREAIEETNIVCFVGDMLAEVDNVPHNVQVSIFKAQYVSGEIAIDTVEIVEARWFTLQEAITLPLAYNTKFIIESL